MSKKKKKKNKKVTDPVSLSEVTSRLRGFLIDSQIQNAHELAVILGCSPLSEELREMEEDESDKRVDRISHLVPLLFAQAHALAESSIEYQKSNITKEIDGLTSETWWESRKILEQVAMSALIGSVSQLVDMGFLKLPKGKKK
jgi:DnaJ-domain-containing protein 1